MIRGGGIFGLSLVGIAIVMASFLLTEEVIARDDELDSLISTSLIMIARGEEASAATLVANMDRAIVLFHRLASVGAEPELEARGELIISDWNAFRSGRMTAWEFCDALEAFLPLLYRHHLELTRSMVFLFIGASVGFALAVVCIYAVFERLMMKGKHSELARIKLRASLEAEEQERKRIARDLHDDAAQTLAAARMLCERAAAAREEPEVRALTAEASSLIRDAGIRIRELVMDLRPPELEAGLPLALESLCARKRSPEGPGVSAHIQRELPAVSNETAIQAYRIAQEGLSNAAKHAPRNRVELSLRGTDAEGKLLLEIRDRPEGRACDAEAAEAGQGGVSQPGPAFDASLSSGTGLSIMGERAELIGGELDFRLEEGGATLLLRFPAGSRKGRT